AAYAALPDPQDAALPLAARARSYLDANCAGCHLPGGPVPIGIDLRYRVPLAAMDLVNVRPNQGDLGLVDAYRIRTGSKESSVLWERMRRLDGTRMPELGTNRVDQPALDLIGTWIDQGPVDK
ncbi:MAG: PQQ-dependent sugar dehydrogenase, partial [Planctomycetota bacterium]